MPSYEADKARFEEANTQVLGVSIDHVPCLRAWAESLGGISYPLLGDFWPHGQVALMYGVLRPEGHSERALFLVDVDGVIRYVDIHDLDDQPDNEVIFEQLRCLQGGEGKTEPLESEPEETTLPSGGVVMYCSRWCADCRRARDWLQSRGIEHSEVDVYAVPGAADRVREWSGGNLVTPTFDVEGTIVIDFDTEKLAEALGLPSADA